MYQCQLHYIERNNNTIIIIIIIIHVTVNRIWSFDITVVMILC